MVRMERIKHTSINVIGDAGSSAYDTTLSTTQRRIAPNGLLYSLEFAASGNTSYTANVGPVAYSGQRLADYLVVNATGNQIYYPTPILVNVSGTAVASVSDHFVLKGGVYLGVGSFVTSSGLKLTINYI